MAALNASDFCTSDSHRNSPCLALPLNSAPTPWPSGTRGLEAVRSDRLVQDNVRVDGDWLLIGDESLRSSRQSAESPSSARAKPAREWPRVWKRRSARDVLAEKQVAGWINVPADCVRKLTPIFISIAARPAGVNEPTAEGVVGARANPRNRRARSAQRSLPVPDLRRRLGPAARAGRRRLAGRKQAITRLLSAAGANIQELNTVRKQLSRIKGGGLARACRAGTLISLIISDVLGDPLDVIASGPTVPDTATAARCAWRCPRSDYRRFDHRASTSQLPTNVAHVGTASQISQQPSAMPTSPTSSSATTPSPSMPPASKPSAAAIRTRCIAATQLEGPAEDVGIHLAQMALRMHPRTRPRLPDHRRRTHRQARPARNPRQRRPQPAARPGGTRRIVELHSIRNPQSPVRNPPRPPLRRHRRRRRPHRRRRGDPRRPNCSPAHASSASIRADFLRRNDAYHFFEPLGGLIQTGPTHTNVCDVRVVVVDRAT